MNASDATTTCLVAGGGPAGMMLGLLLARAGIDVTVMEKHADFLRDFRGDTVHASTLRLLDELGLGAQFAALPHRMIEGVNATIQDTTLHIDLRRLPGPHKHIALVPQWDFLELLATAARREPTFRLLRSTEVLGLTRSGGKVTGVRYRDADGVEKQMHAHLTVACDGRSSILRQDAGLATRNFGAPMDVWWFRLPRHADDLHGLNGVFQFGHGCALIDRGDYFQIAYLIRKGADAAMREEGIESLRREITELVPWLADRVDQLASFDDVKLLDVQLNRLRRWYADGLLLIGDAAHAMSPIGGVGINLAVADAVAAARILAGPLRTHSVTRRRLAAVQARRWLPAAIIQRVQRTVQDRAIAVAIGNPEGLREAPRAVVLANRFPALRAIAAYGVAIGPLPEHAPDYARR
ncbi:FAD-dependent oxidoreductase [Mycolicibacterium lacusdiani]|uniref:FAD-dependent oxidoreductase n=1 Tax=Mycolicibacterium lacusdiani TaxID=2895283 RepID=UPI0027DFC2EE|nr:FAD-dependent oxidoreductase [Mycolicibacterium lacusdiani]